MSHFGASLLAESPFPRYWRPKKGLNPGVTAWAKKLVGNNFFFSFWRGETGVRVASQSSRKALFTCVVYTKAGYRNDCKFCDKFWQLFTSVKIALLILDAFAFSLQTTNQFYKQYKDALQKLNLSSAPNITAYTYDALWTVAASLNKSVPKLEAMGLKLQDFHRNKTEMTKLFVQTIQDIHFLGVTVGRTAFLLSPKAAFGGKKRDPGNEVACGAVSVFNSFFGNF